MSTICNPRYQVVDRVLYQHWYENFQKRWRTCTQCPLHKHRERVVQFRGRIPADILFIGEAPGESENELGRPFVTTAPAGRTLDMLLDEAGLEDGDYCIINAVGCMPWDEEKNAIRAPSQSEVKYCSPRIVELISKINPKLIVLLGSVAIRTMNFLPEETPTLCLVHPSSIARGGSKPLDIKRFVLSLQQSVSKIRNSV